MKRVFTILLTFVMLFSIVVTPAFASTPSVSNDEISAVRSEMELRGMPVGGLVVDEVFDSEDTPRYLLGVTDTGYIILERKSLVFHESGEQNPYSAYMSAKKYYGGPLNYYVASTAQVQATNGQKMMFSAMRIRIRLHKHYSWSERMTLWWRIQRRCRLLLTAKARFALLITMTISSDERLVIMRITRVPLLHRPLH